MQHTGSANGKVAAERVKAFEYPADPRAPGLPVSELWSGAGIEDGSGMGEESQNDAGLNSGKAAQRGEMDARLTEENRKGFEAGRERGLQEGRQAEREAQAAAQSAAEERRMRRAA